MLKNDPSDPPLNNSSFVHIGNFDIHFLEPIWEIPGSDSPEQVNMHPRQQEICLCLRGSGRLELNGSVYTAACGVVWFTSANAPAHWHEYNKQETLILRVPFVLTQARDICNTLQDRMLSGFLQRCTEAEERRSAVIGYNQSLCDYSDFLKRRISIACRCGFESILMAFLLDAVSSLDHAPQTQTEAEYIASYVKDNALQGISVGDLAKHLSVSERSLFYMFTKHFQTSPNNYINRIRMEAAAECLSKGLSVREVSELFKFSELSSFCRMFKKYYEVTPSEYRKNVPATNKRSDV